MHYFTNLILYVKNNQYNNDDCDNNDSMLSVRH